MARILLNPFGSLGDLHPFLALAIELQHRGHQATIATSEAYRAKVGTAGVGFAPVRPDIGDLLEQPDVLAKLWDPAHGTEYLIRDYLAPRIEESYTDLDEACTSADLLLTHSAAYAGPIVAEVRRLPWLSIVLQPSLFLSAYDPPVLPPTWVKSFYGLGRPAIRMLFALGRAHVRAWCKPILQLRRRLSLPTLKNPVFEAQFSPHGTLALFSPRFAAPQPDWPPRTSTTGFVFYDQLGAGFAGFTRERQETAAAELNHFLRAGPPPLLFTLGSSAVMQPGNFFEESVEAALRLDMRAVLLVGRQQRDQLRRSIPESILLADYAPYSQVMPQASAIVHQGGIGTTAQALRAGRPMLVVPWAHDQPDNAQRTQKLGVARTLNRKNYHGKQVAAELRLLLEPSYAQAATRLSQQLAAEKGLAAACDEIEATLKRSAAG